jgi:hypothetical protein
LTSASAGLVGSNTRSDAAAVMDAAESMKLRRLSDKVVMGRTGLAGGIHAKAALLYVARSRVYLKHIIVKFVWLMGLTG